MTVIEAINIAIDNKNDQISEILDAGEDYLVMIGSGEASSSGYTKVNKKNRSKSLFYPLDNMSYFNKAKLIKKEAWDGWNTNKEQ